MNTLRRTCPLFARALTVREHLNLTSKVLCSTEVPKLKEESYIVVEKCDDNLVTTIGINRPHRKNALDTKTAQQLVEALDEFEKDKESTVAVLHGLGGSFCSGFDLHELAEYDGESEDQVPQFGPLSKRCLTQIKKPIVASISGFAVGAGFELALMCDLRVLDDTAVMGFLNRRFGIPILMGGTVRLPMFVGYGRAMDMILTGRPINAKEALACGLANEVVSCGSALGQALMLAKCLTKFPQKTLLADRTSTHHATFSSDQFAEKLQFEKDNASHLLYEEGVTGAKRYQGGLGRNGNFKNLVDRNKTFKELDKELL